MTSPTQGSPSSRPKRFCCLGVLAENIGCHFGTEDAYLPQPAATMALYEALVPGANVIVDGTTFSVDSLRNVAVRRPGACTIPAPLGQDFYATLNDHWDFTFDQIADVIDAILDPTATITIEA